MQKAFGSLQHTWKRYTKTLYESVLKMASIEEAAQPTKRQQLEQEPGDGHGPESKRSKNDDSKGKSEMVLAREAGLPYQKKKCALMMMYSGKGYVGMQIQKNEFATIEKDLFSALVKSGVVIQAHVDDKRMEFQRAARTDKGVSAVGQLCSLKMFVDVENPVEKVNQHLPDQIRCLDIFRATKNFDSKNSCSGRSYFYLLPSFAFAPIEEIITEEYRITDEIVEKVNQTLEKFKGTHNFFNYSSGRKANDPSCKRYITAFACSKPFVQDGLEMVEITIKGQSFILHQIRKMIGTTIACVRGYCTEEAIEKSWNSERMDIPRAPGLGLVLDKAHFDVYNKRYGTDGMHKSILWENYKEQIDEFKRLYIFKEIIETEKNEKSMLGWLSNLPVHSFDVVPDVVITEEAARTVYGEAKKFLHQHQNQQNEEESDKKDNKPVIQDPLVTDMHVVQDPLVTDMHVVQDPLVTDMHVVQDPLVSDKHIHTEVETCTRDSLVMEEHQSTLTGGESVVSQKCDVVNNQT